MEALDKTKENRLRRQLAKAGYLLRKSRKDLNIDNHGGYMITDIYTNAVYYGHLYDLTLNDVEEIVQDLK